MGQGLMSHVCSQAVKKGPKNRMLGVREVINGNVSSSIFG
jgi:hypothetical protein